VNKRLPAIELNVAITDALSDRVITLALMKRSRRARRAWPYYCTGALASGMILPCYAPRRPRLRGGLARRTLLSDAPLGSPSPEDRHALPDGQCDRRGVHTKGGAVQPGTRGFARPRSAAGGKTRDGHNAPQREGVVAGGGMLPLRYQRGAVQTPPQGTEARPGDKWPGRADRHPAAPTARSCRGRRLKRLWVRLRLRQLRGAPVQRRGCTTPPPDVGPHRVMKAAARNSRPRC